MVRGEGNMVIEEERKCEKYERGKQGYGEKMRCSTDGEGKYANR